MVAQKSTLGKGKFRTKEEDGRTTLDLIQVAGEHPLILGSVFIAPPILTFICGIVHGKGKGGTSPWKDIYSVLVYSACVPGLFSAVLTAYTVFLSRENLLGVNPLVYFVPIVSMAVTLVLIRKSVPFNEAHRHPSHP